MFTAVKKSRTAEVEQPSQDDNVPDLAVSFTDVRLQPISDDRASCVVPLDLDSKGKSVGNER